VDSSGNPVTATKDVEKGNVLGKFFSVYSLMRKQKLKKFCKAIFTFL